MNVSVNFKCPCGAIVDGWLTPPDPNFSVESAADSACEDFESLSCEGCKKEHLVHVVNSMYGVEIRVEDVESLSYEEVYYPESAEDIAWIFEVGSHFEKDIDTHRLNARKRNYQATSRREAAECARFSSEFV